MSKEKETGLVQFREIYKGKLNSDGNLSDFKNDTLIIKDVEFGTITVKGKETEYAIATCDYNQNTLRLHTFSKVLIDQLKVIKSEIDKSKSEGKPITVKVRVTKVKNYYTFE